MILLNQEEALEELYLKKWIINLMSTLQRAIEIAVEAHKGQTDKSGLDSNSLSLL